jgi:hypothetical protein
MGIPVHDSYEELEPEAQEVAAMTCAYLVNGEIPSTARVPSVRGVCAECGAGIFFSAVNSPRIRKVCCRCTLAKIDADGGNFDMNVFEDTVTEVLQTLGLPDTPETRTVVLSIQKDQFLAWLRDNVKNMPPQEG